MNAIDAAIARMAQEIIDRIDSAAVNALMAEFTPERVNETLRARVSELTEQIDQLKKLIE